MKIYADKFMNKFKYYDQSNLWTNYLIILLSYKFYKIGEKNLLTRTELSDNEIK